MELRHITDKMLDDKRIKEAESNIRQYLQDYMLKKQANKTAQEMYLENCDGLRKLSNRVVLVPIKISSDFENFLLEWKLDISSLRYFLLPLTGADFLA